MRIMPSALYSSEFDSVMQFLHSHPSGNDNAHLELFSKATTNLIDTGSVSKENISSYIHFLSKALVEGADKNLNFSKNLKSAIQCICDSSELNEQHLDELKSVVRFVIDNSYDFSSSEPKAKSYLMYRGWTGDDHGNIASLFLSNKSATAKHYKIVIESYLDLLVKEFGDFGPEAYAKISKAEYSNENIFKSCLVESLSKLPLSKRVDIGRQYLSIIDELGCKIANRNPDFILHCSIFSDFVGVVCATMNEQCSDHQMVMSTFDENKAKSVADFLKNITSHNNSHEYLSEIDFRLVGEKDYGIILKGLLEGIEKFSDPSDLYKKNAARLITSMLISASRLLEGNGFSRSHFEIILDSKLMENLAKVDHDQALIMVLGRSIFWQHDDIMKHWDYLIKTDTLHSVVESSASLTESDIESIYTRYLHEGKQDNNLSKDECELAILGRLYNNHYAPKLISGEKVTENRLAPIMENLLSSATLTAADLTLLAKVDLRKVISDCNHRIRQELDKPHNSVINEQIISILLNNTIDEISSETSIAKTIKRHV